MRCVVADEVGHVQLRWDTVGPVVVRQMRNGDLRKGEFGHGRLGESRKGMFANG